MNYILVVNIFELPQQKKSHTNNCVYIIIIINGILQSILNFKKQKFTKIQKKNYVILILYQNNVNNKNVWIMSLINEPTISLLPEIGINFYTKTHTHSCFFSIPFLTTLQKKKKPCKSASQNGLILIIYIYSEMDND